MSGRSPICAGILWYVAALLPLVPAVVHLGTADPDAVIFGCHVCRSRGRFKAGGLSH